jgi:hypothetical protein
MPKSSIIDNRLTINLDLSPSLFSNAQFQMNPDNRAHLANQLLLYEQLIIPTNDFGILPILYSWFGDKYFFEALEKETFQFLHKPSMLGYAGNGAGIVSFAISGSGERELEWHQKAIFSELETALELQINNTFPNLHRKQRTNLLDLVRKQSQSVNFVDHDFDKWIVHESYIDILKTPELKALVTRLSGNLYRIDLTRLPGVKPDDMKVSSQNPIKEAVDVVLKVAEVNLSLLMANQIGDCDLSVPEGTQDLLISKLVRSGMRLNTANNFIQLLDLNNLPDPGKAIISGDLSLSDIWKLREKSLSKKFRNWLRSAKTDDARELEKMYVESLGKDSIIDTLPVGIIRFAIILGVGMVNPLVGLGVDIADSFFVDKWLNGFTPKLFIDQLNRLYGVKAIK